MYRKIDDYEWEINSLRKENDDLKRRLTIMQDTIRRYQIEKQEMMKKHGITRMGPKIGVDEDVVLEN